MLLHRLKQLLRVARDQVRNTYDSIHNYFLHGRHRRLTIDDVADLVNDDLIRPDALEVTLDVVRTNQNRERLNTRRYARAISSTLH